MLQLEYLPLQAAAQRLEDRPPGLLGVVGFPGIQLPADNPVPSARVGIASVDHTDALCEVWTASEPAIHASLGRIRYATTANFMFGALSSPESQGPLEARSRALYEEIFALLEGSGYPHVLRFWNYIPRINEVQHGAERYRLFNVGRHDAFESAHRMRQETIPAASGLGTLSGEELTVYFVAARAPGRQIENPRQVHAWQYPGQYGLKSPVFARAVAYPFEAPTLLFVSGTASIVGHETMHGGDVAAQARESLANLGAVFAEAARFGAFRLRQAKFKAYVRDAAYVPILRAEVAAALGEGVEMTCLVADICRSDLLVEIEAFAVADAARAR